MGNVTTLVEEPGDLVSRPPNPETVVRLLKGVERLPDGATGALVFGGNPGDRMLVENKRICWASASGMEPRLTDLLIEESEVEIGREDIEQIYARCHEAGTPLGETLVSGGVVSAAGLKHSLRRHTAEAVALLATTDELSAAWEPNRRRRYDAQYTFSPAEILARVGAIGQEPEGEEAERLLRDLLREDGRGFAFLHEHEEHALPLAELRGDRMGVQGIVELGDWAVNTLATCRRFESEADLVVAEIRGTQVAAWLIRPMVVVGVFESRATLTRTIRRRAQSKAD